MNIGKWRAGAAVQMCVVSERLGVCQEYCLGVVGVILCVCVYWGGRMGKAGGVPPFLQPHLYFRSVAVWEVFSLIPPPCSLSALKVETSVPRYISPSLPIYPSPSRATSPGGLSSCEQQPSEFHWNKMFWIYRMGAKCWYKTYPGPDTRLKMGLFSTVFDWT